MCDKYRGFFVFFFAVVLSAWAAAGTAVQEYKDEDYRRICAMTAGILDRNHYEGKRMTPELSAKIFDGFIEDVDPLHIFFTAEEVEEFAKIRETLGSMIKRGEYGFAFEVYDLYKDRYAEYREFSEEMLAKEIDFTVDESIPADPKDMPRPKNEAEMQDLWRKHLKNELIILRLSEKTSGDNSGKSPVDRILQRQRDVGNSVAKRDRIDVLEILLNAMAQAYGAHSDYQAPKASEDFEIHMSLSLSGIGATLSSEDGYIKIVELVPGGPAELSGKIKVNDRIISLTQENGEFIELRDMPLNNAVQYIRGEKGSKVVLDILRENVSAPQKVTLIRDKVNLVEGAAKGEVRKIDAVKVGIITLPSFYMDFEAVMRGDKDARRASADVQRILEDFKKEGVQSVLVDLRGNGGGSMPDAVVLSGLFLKGGPVVQIRSKEGVELENDPDSAAVYDGPLVVLTNKLSASAAEIFAGALSSAKRAVIVGDSRTFGKGTILQVEDLDRYNSWFRDTMPAGAVTFEIAMFFRPDGPSVQQLGMVPDIQLPSLTEEMQVGEFYLDNHLPWDSMPAAKNLHSHDAGFPEKIAVLQSNSAARIAKDERYQSFIRQVELYRELRDRKTISLNEEVRHAEYLREKQVSEEADRLLYEEDSDSEDGSMGDVVLNEALNIAADLYRLQK